MNVSKRITNILNYYQNNPGCDPNMFEYIGLCYDMVQYLIKAAPDYGLYSGEKIVYDEDGNPKVNHLGKIIYEVETSEERRQQNPIPFVVKEKFEILSKQFEQKLLSNDLGITQESPLYRLYEEVHIGVGTYSAYGDTPVREKIGGVALYIAQKKREVAKGLISEFRYDNDHEMEEIQKLNLQFPDPTTGGYFIRRDGEKEDTYVVQIGARQLLFEEIMHEYQKGSMRM